MDIERIIIEAESGGIRYTLAMLKRYVEEAKSYGDELDVSTFSDSFEEYLRKHKQDMERYDTT